MKRAAIALLVILTTLAAAPSPTTSPTPAAEQDGIRVYFSPQGGCTEAVVNEIANTKISLDVQAYSFTSAAIAKAVHEAHERGVKVRVVLDKSQKREKYTSATYLLNSGVPVWIDSQHAIAHNKVMLIDGQTIITGSFNFTSAAEKSNAENLLIISGKPKLFEGYEANFEQHLKHSEKYEGLEAKKQ